MVQASRPCAAGPVIGTRRHGRGTCARGGSSMDLLRVRGACCQRKSRKPHTRCNPTYLSRRLRGAAAFLLFPRAASLCSLPGATIYRAIRPAREVALFFGFSFGTDLYDWQDSSIKQHNHLEIPGRAKMPESIRFRSLREEFPRTLCAWIPGGDARLRRVLTSAGGGGVEAIGQQATAQRREPIGCM